MSKDRVTQLLRYILPEAFGDSEVVKLAAKKDHKNFMRLLTCALCVEGCSAIYSKHIATLWREAKERYEFTGSRFQGFEFSEDGSVDWQTWGAWELQKANDKAQEFSSVYHKYQKATIELKEPVPLGAYIEKNWDTTKATLRVGVLGTQLLHLVERKKQSLFKAEFRDKVKFVNRTSCPSGSVSGSSQAGASELAEGLGAAEVPTPQGRRQGPPPLGDGRAF